jgi:alkylation response protein AidB-like acyl-CoA dehydrogenase
MNARTDAWRAAVTELAQGFAKRAGEADEGDEFVADNYAELKAAGLLAAGVPRELGGEGLELPDLAEMLRAIAQACSSTALAFSMHTHQVAVQAWRWRQQKAPVGPFLEKIAREKIVLLSTGGGDWLDSSGEAKPAPGGYMVNTRKAFCSGAPAGQLLLTSALLRTEGAPAEVIHFGIPMSTPGIQVHATWRTMGMRATASHDVELRDVFVPEAAVSARRAPGKWHPLFHLISMLALPLIYSVYVGVAEAARERALAAVRRRRTDEHLLQLVGEMENRLTTARVLHADWVALSATAQPGPETTNRSLARRTLVGRAVLDTVDAAMEVAGGAAFFRANGLERLFRDAQGARYHPIHAGAQRALAGKAALGMEL